jgi:hypothetical protein
MKRTRIKLMPDYGCWPLWGTGSQVGNIDPRMLPLSPKLVSLLERWSRMYNETLDQDHPPNSQFKSEEERRIFNELGRELFQSLRRELGTEYEISYQNHYDEDAFR